MSEGFRAPVQSRSKTMLERLLRATIAVIGEDGIEGATIPRIAAEAKIAPAGVYRRFRDKDALIQAAFLSALQDGGPTSRRAFDREAFSRFTLDEALDKVVSTLFNQYRSSPRFLKAFLQFYENHPDAGFRARALTGLRSNLEVIIDALLACPEIAEAPQVERMVTFGVLTVATAIEAMVLTPNTLWTAIQPVTEAEVQVECVRLLRSYLRSSA